MHNCLNKDDDFILLSRTHVAEYETTQFNAKDWALFFSMLDNPPEPTERMKKAAKMYHKIITEHEL